MTWNWRGARRARRQNVFNYICRGATALGGTALITARWTAAVIKHVEREETVELLEQARPRARCRRAGGVDVDFVVISEGLWTELLLICLPCVCV